MSELIVIGNGTSAIDRPLGNIIDSYRKIIRFNNYETKNFETFIGTKTTHWFNTINFQNKEKEWRIHDLYEEIYLHSWEWDLTKDVLYKSFINYFEEKKLKNIIKKTKRETISEIQNYTNDNKYFTYSTGAIAIWLLLKQHSSIDIVGFDWWERNKHHYHDDQKIGNIHKPNLEKILIDKLLAENKIQLL